MCLRFVISPTPLSTSSRAIVYAIFPMVPFVYMVNLYPNAFKQLFVLFFFFVGLTMEKLTGISLFFPCYRVKRCGSLGFSFCPKNLTCFLFCCLSRQCPIDLKEAVASIIFAAPRCSDLAELLQVRNLFGAKYGKEFVAAAAELRPDCGVNRLVSFYLF